MMEKRKMGLLFAFTMLLVLMMSFSCVNANEPILEGDKYIAPFGSKFEFVDSNDIVIKSSNENIARVSGKTVSIVGVGHSTLSFETSNKRGNIQLFACNVHLKNGKYTTYKYDTSKGKIKSTNRAMQAEIFIAASKEGKYLKIEDYIFGNKGKYSGSLNGLYITSYYDEAKNKSTAKNYEFSMKENSTVFTFVVPDLLLRRDIVDISENLNEEIPSPQQDDFIGEPPYEEVLDIEELLDDEEIDDEVEEVESLNTYTVTVKEHKHGSVYPSGTIKVGEGKSQTFTITPNDKYVIDTIKLSYKNEKKKTKTEKVTATNNTYILKDVRKDYTLDVTFKTAPKYKIEVSVGKNGSVSPKTVSVYQGKDQDFTIKPNSGYEIDKLLIDGVQIEPTTSYTFENVTKKHKIKVTFKKATATSQAPTTTSQLVTVTQPTTGNGSSAADMKLFLASASNCAKFFYNNHDHGDENVAGVHGKLDCVSFVEYVLRDYFNKKGNATYANSKFSKSNIKTWLSEANKLYNNKSAAKWMSDNFEVVAINSSESGILGFYDNDLNKVHDNLKVGDILVFYSKYNGYENKHIEILGSLGKVKKNAIVYGSYTVADSKFYKTVGELGNGNPWSYDRDEYRFEFMKAVLRLKN